MVEAEYTAAAEAARAVIWIKQMAKEWRIDLKHPTVRHIENQVAIKMTTANEVADESKHIHTKCHVRQKNISLIHVPGTAVNSHHRLRLHIAVSHQTHIHL